MLNPIQTARHIVNEHGTGALFRGFSACAVREAIYTAGYLGLAPVFTSYLTNLEMFQGNSLAAGIFGASAAGILVSSITHPVDTCKTCVQSDMLGQKYPSALRTAWILLDQGGVASLFKGLIPRVARNCGAFFICMTLRDKAIDFTTEQIQL